ncbi:MAG: DUF5615 family PIN-like protein [bacterium]|nr:DUF5615 family PIN-like protein [bacterium]
MKLLVDENLPNAVAETFSAKGFDCVKVSPGSSDAAIITLAKKEQRVLLTLDKDFADILAYPPQKYYGIICLRIKRPLIIDIMRMIDSVLSYYKTVPIKGKLIVVTEKGFRVRE